MADDGTVTPLGIFDDASFSETSGVFSGSDDFSVQVAAGNSLSFEPYTEQYSGLAGDLDRDGRLTGRDDGRFSGALGSGGGDDTYDPLGDLDQDGDIDAADESAFDSQLADFGTCVEDFYPDGTIDYSDLTLFLTYFNNGHRFADLNDDGSVDYSDVLVMLPAVSAGTCP